MKHLIDCAMGRIPCDLVVTNIRIFNVFTGELERNDLAIKNGVIVAVGTGFRAERVLDGGGAVALPGLIDSHIHVESSLLSPEEFASLAAVHGTTAIVADPHEIVNVCGIEGAEYIAEAFARLKCGEVQPLDLYLQLPSCVPATPFETSGAQIDGAETARELKRSLFTGLGEMMNYPAVLGAEEDCLKKLTAAREEGKTVDGHAPALSGKKLCAYRCGGITTDHESLTAEECREKAARGMYVQLRAGSTANNIKETAKAVDGFNFRRFLLCSDDKNARDLCRKGHIDDALRQAVASGIPAEYAVCMATINAAECYGLKRRGALAPDYFADIVLVEDMKDFRVRTVLKRGTIVAENGKPLFSRTRYLPATVRDTVRLGKVHEEDFRICIKSGKARAMVLAPYGLVTNEEIVTVQSTNGDICVKGTDLNKLAVIERHGKNGNIGLGLIKGFGLRGASIGISVSHDSHNLVIAGTDNAQMARVAALLKEAGGGMAFVSDAREEVFALDIAGLMSSADAEEVVSRSETLINLAREAGVKECYEPYMALAFLALPVIPKLKLTDRGLVDVERFAFTKTEVKEENE